MLLGLLLSFFFLFNLVEIGLELLLIELLLTDLGLFIASSSHDLLS